MAMQRQQVPERPALQGSPARAPPPAYGAGPAPAHATQRRAPPSSGALWRGSRSARGGAKRPFKFLIRAPLSDTYVDQVFQEPLG